MSNGLHQGDINCFIACQPDWEEMENLRGNFRGFWEGIIQNEVILGGSPAINVTLGQQCKQCKQEYSAMLLSSLMTSFCLQSNVLTNVQASQNAKMGSITLLDHFQDWLPMKLFLDDFSNIVFFRFFLFWRTLRIQNSVFSILFLRTQGNWSSEGMASFGFSFWMVRALIQHIHYHYPTCSFVWNYTVEKSWQKCRPPHTLRKNLFCTH